MKYVCPLCDFDLTENFEEHVVAVRLSKLGYMQSDTMVECPGCVPAGYPRPMQFWMGHEVRVKATAGVFSSDPLWGAMSYEMQRKMITAINNSLINIMMCPVCHSDVEVHKVYPSAWKSRYDGAAIPDKEDLFAGSRVLGEMTGAFTEDQYEAVDDIGRRLYHLGMIPHHYRLVSNYILFQLKCTEVTCKYTREMTL